MSSLPTPRPTPIRYVSTREASSAGVGFAEALLQGLAPDGGLYVPLSWPRVLSQDLPQEGGLARLASALLAGFVADDPIAEQLPAITAEAFTFAAPVVPLDPNGRLSVLELFHGPTAAFKDFGARFLAAAFGRLRAPQAQPLTILVATSGDTGGAVASAFHQRAGFEVGVLYPKGLVSPTQERQLTCWGGNVQSFAVRGTFDDCQRLVKHAFADASLRRERALSSANSINLGRLLPQMVYYAATSLQLWREHRERASFVIPSGNLGNALACLWARQVGLPIDRIVLAHNANRTVADYLRSGEWQPRASVATLASAMDVGNPSNMERLRALYPQLESVRAAVAADTVDDAAIRARIRLGFERYGQMWCPHTATAAEVHDRMAAAAAGSGGLAGRWVVVATAHPAKFPEIVEPLIGRAVPVPETLARLLARPTACTEIGADPAELRAALSRRRV